MLFNLCMQYCRRSHAYTGHNAMDVQDMYIYTCGGQKCMAIIYISSICCWVILMLYCQMKHSQVSKSQVVAHTSVCCPSCVWHIVWHIMVGQTELSTQAYNVMHDVILIYELRTHQLEGYYACVYIYYTSTSRSSDSNYWYDMVDHPVQSYCRTFRTSVAWYVATNIYIMYACDMQWLLNYLIRMHACAHIHICRPCTYVISSINYIPVTENAPVMGRIECHSGLAFGISS